MSVRSYICVFALLAVGLSARGANYYVNDASTNGDVFCSAVGADGVGRGTNAATPMLSVNTLLSTYDIAPGDTVYIDTGTYSNYTVNVPLADAGSGSVYVTFQGSTNGAAGGTVFRPTAGAYGWYMYALSYVRINDVAIQGGSQGVYLDSCSFVDLQRVTVRNASSEGFFIQGGGSLRLLNCLGAFNAGQAVRASSTTGVSPYLQNCVFWGADGIYALSATLALSNSSIRVSGAASAAFRTFAGGVVKGDYNNIFLENGAAIANRDGQVDAQLSDYVQISGQERHSAVFDPLFANPAGYDFHPRSPHGRFLPGTGFVTNDTALSPLVDMGHPAWSAAQESPPNGGRINVGLYGNTPEASRSPGTPTLTALSYNDGGTIVGTGAVYWAAAGYATGATVRVEYSLDAGATWLAVATNVTAAGDTAIWNTTTDGSSARALWRVQYEAATGTWDAVDRVLSVHNTNLFFYVNDAAQAGDVYCTAAGSVTNDGVTPATPQASLAALVAMYDLNGGDTVYVDTGTYSGSSTIALGPADRGVAGNRLQIVGSTNSNGQVTLLQCMNTANNVMTLGDSDYCRLANLTLQGGQIGLELRDSDSCIVQSVVARNSAFAGFQIGRAGAAANGTYLANCLAFDNASYGMQVAASLNTTIRQCTMAGSQFALDVNNNATASISNSILSVSGSGRYAYSVSLGGSLKGDYNLFHVTNSAAPARINSVTYADLHAYQEATGLDRRSTVMDPLFAGAGGGDYTLKSTAGRWNGSVFTNDAVTSPGVDFGDPASAYALETAPNGGRANAGVFGNTAIASRSPTNPTLLALTLNDGGTFVAPGDAFYWSAAGFPSGATVRIEFSPDSGGSWVVVETGLLASAQAYTWSATNFASSRFARWRVVYEADTNVVDMVNRDFVFRYTGSPFTFYLNDASLAGDVYTAAAGNDANLGTSPLAPKYSLQSVLNVHAVQPGDLIFVDTGQYNLGSNNTFAAGDSGGTNDYVYLIGSTNLAAGGSVFNRQSTAATSYALELSGAAYIHASDLVLRNAGTGLRLSSSANSRFQRVRCEDNGDGISASSSTGIDVDQAVLRRNASRGLYVTGGVVNVRRGVFFRNASAAVRVDAGAALLSNCIVQAVGAAAFGYHAATSTNIAGTHNVFFMETNAVVGFIAALGRGLDTLGAWSAETGRERDSLEVDPLFADANAGDFHLKTEAPLGRALPNGAGYTNDAVTSPLIDAGPPSAAFTNEPAPNGARVNIGYFGDTAEASRSPSAGRLTAATLREGGYVTTTGLLHWVAGGAATSGTVTVELSPDGGETWTVLATGLAATAESAGFDPGVFGSTPAARWRVRHDAWPGVADAPTNFFAIRGGPLALHVNDAATAGDVFTTAPGAPTNFVATAARPLGSLADAFRLFDLEPGDTIFADSGLYTNEATVAIGRRDSGTAAARVTVIGSTNASAAATVIEHATTGAGEYGLHFSSAAHVVVSNLVLRNANRGVLASSSSSLQFGRVRAAGHAGSGFEFQTTTNVVLRRVVAVRNGARGIDASAASSIAVEHAVIWSNTLGAVQVNGGLLTISNAVLKAAGAGRPVFSVQGGAACHSDYNDVLQEGGAIAGTVGSALYPTLDGWQALGRDVNSLSHDPLFADAGADDFHPRSEAGRWLPSGGLTNDAVTSPLLDTGAPPPWPYAAEPAPNGARVNIGLYGGTPGASLSRTNGWLLALTLNSGGAMRATNSLRWVAGGVATGHTVTAQFSGDGGTTWTNIAAGVNAAAGTFTWNSVPFGSSALAVWRVVSETDTNISDATDNTFVLFNGPLTYYVNDTNTAGDVYTAAPGSAGNDGATPGAPKDSIQGILDSYPLHAGDTILVDTGVYPLPSTISVGEYVTGTPTNPVTIRGSTNTAAGGTTLNRQGGSYAISIANNSDIVLQHLQITNASPAVLLSQTTNALLEFVGIHGGAYGVQISASPEAMLRRLLIRACTRGVYQTSAQVATLENCVLWSNTYAVSADAGTVRVSNTVIAALGPSQAAYHLQPAAAIVADYNDLFLTNGAVAAVRLTTPKQTTYQTVSRWVRDYGQDAHSLSHDPLFGDPDAGDFHPRSRAGRLTPSGGTTNDAVTSPLIDAGSPAAAWTNEPAPNGGRLNIGLYGNTPQAGATPTNAALLAVSLNDGGRAEGIKTLHWNATGAATGHTVRIDYSADAGLSWSVVTSGLVAAAGGFAWDTTSQTSSILARWRVVSLTDTNIGDATDANFALRNAPFQFFVNDVSTNGDVYVTAPGSVSNSALAVTSPAASVQQVLSGYDLESGDTIRVDTGVYDPPAAITVGEFDAGSAAAPVTILGSTNEVAGGSLFRTNGFLLNGTTGLRLQDLTVSGAAGAVRLVAADTCAVVRVTAIRGSTGFEVSGGTGIVFSNCVARNGSGAGLYVWSGAAGVAFRSGVLWSNLHGVRIDGGTLDVRNSVIGAFGVSAAAYYHGSGTLIADYNDIVLRNGAAAGYQPGAPFPTIHPNLSRWTRDFGQDARSLSHEPLFADAEQGDFHPRSAAGRFVVAGGYTNDLETSPMLDAADPAAPFGGEPAPNGGRADQGRFGNDAQASLSPTNRGFTVLSLNDGGRAEGTVTLHWIARGEATGDLVRLEFSADGGTVWTTIVSGISASTQRYAWASTGFPSTALGLWRVVSLDDTNVSDVTDAPFALRNTPLQFYVNDAATTGDVFCTAAGSAANAGLLPSAPKASVQDVIDTYDLEPGDRVLIDTGLYTLTSDIVIGAFDQGSGTNRVVFEGSADGMAGGTEFTRGGGANGVRIEQASAVELRNLSLRNLGTGVRVYQSDGVMLQGVDVGQGTWGYDVTDSDGVVLRNCSARQMTYGLGITISSGLLFENGVLWSNTFAVYLNNGTAALSNSVIGAFGSGAYAYYFQLGTPAALGADYNDLFVTNGAGVAYQAGTPATIHQTVARWVRDTGRDAHSLSHEPGFAAPGAGDFHLLSAAGRLLPGSGYTNDAVSSVLLDAAAPSAAYAAEPAPNGARRNIGRHGNRAGASLSPATPSLTVVSLSDGGRIEGTNFIYWVARGSATGHTVRLDFSPDDGASWLPIASNVAAAAGSNRWDSTLAPNTILGRWRVTDEVETNVWDVTDKAFAVRNGPIGFYVNDAGTAGDVYCAVAGTATNLGVSPATPKTSVQDVLNTYDLEPGDVIYIDTGNYTLTAPVTVGPFDAGTATNRVTLQGSTNSALGGTVLNRFGGDRCLVVDGAPGVAIRHLTLRNATTAALRLYDADHALVEWVRAEGSLVGFEVDDCAGATFAHCVARANTQRGIWSRLSTLQWDNGVVWSNALGLAIDSGSATVANTVFGAFQASASAYFLGGGSLTSDYNDLFVTNGANVGLILGGSVGGGTSRYVSVGAWAAATGRDTHSLSHEPRFVNAAAGDFHLRSQAGHYVPGSGFTNDTDTSLLIDAGNPAASAAAEPAPNGGRLNIGYAGGSTEASKSPTNSVLTAVSFNDGGSASGSVALNWVARGNAATQTVRLDYSLDGGATYSNIAAGISAAAGTYVWNSTLAGTHPAVVWRIAGETETNAQDRTDGTFYLRNGGGMTYYVNDASTNGDVFATAAGAATNLGYLASAPKNSIQDVLDTFDLEPGDRVLVDTGVYNLTADITVGDLDAGAAASFVTIEGSTNAAAGGTLINRQVATTNTSVFRLYQTAGLQLKNLRLTGAGVGVRLDQSASCRFSGLSVEGNSLAAFLFTDSSSHVLAHCRALDNGDGIRCILSSITVQNATIWKSGTALDLNQSTASVRNSVLQGSGSGRRIYKVSTGSTLTGDYNNLVRTNGAYLAEVAQPVGGSDYYQTLTDWVQKRPTEAHSLSHEPSFAVPDAGDFHPLSLRGRYLPGSGYVTDVVHSVLIDTGDPASVWTNEVAPNGDRVDIGAYGNRDESSLSRSNAWLLAVTFNDGGSVGGTNALHWAHGNLATDGTVRVEYSLTGGVDWQTIASNVPVASTAFLWDVSALSPTVRGLWRVTSESTPGVTDTVDNTFIIRTSALTYYVNDASTNGDVYTTAAGHPTNAGTSAAAPLPSLAHVMNSYPLLPGDQVFVDTGTYALTNAIVLNEIVRGETGVPIRIQGSTNRAAGGSVLSMTTNLTASVLSLSQTRFVDVDHLVLSGGGSGLSVQNTEQCNFSWIDVVGARTNGIVLNAALPVTFNHCVSRQHGGAGLVSGDQTSAIWLHGVIWSNRSGAVRMNGGSVQVANSILHAAGPAGFVYMVGSSFTLLADYNVLWREDGAGLARNAFLSQTYANMVEWQAAYGQDAHSLQTDPLFAAPAAGDFHVLSEGGRFSNGVFTADAQTSVAIDGGNPASTYVAETMPNGGRANIGLFGNTAEAGRTPPVPHLHAISLADGGTVRGAVNLYWLAQGFAATSTVAIQYSGDAGGTWTNIATGVAVSTGSYAWNPSGYPSSPAARWRVISEADTNVVGAVGTNFFLRIGRIDFFVNDTATAGDVYCSVPGSVTNLGLGPAAPMGSLQQVLDAYDLDGGDAVFIDTGVYSNAFDTIIGALDSGLSTSRVRIVGSTNRLAGGTVLDRMDPGFGDTAALRLSGAAHVELSHLFLQRAGVGLGLFQSSGVVMSNLLVRACGSAGVKFDLSGANQLSHSVVTRVAGVGVLAQQSAGNTLLNVVVWSNGSHAVSLSQSSIGVTNSVLHAAGSGAYCYYFQGVSSFGSDYNDLYPERGALFGQDASGLPLESLAQWTLSRGLDAHSLSVDPLFGHPAVDDYHLRSVVGRYHPTSGVFTADAEHSYLIDTGDPLAAYAREPAPNGSRINIGVFGNTPEASMGRTNAWLLALTASSGGRLQGSVYLDWAWGAVAATNTVRLDYSYDNGVSWTNIAAGVPVADTQYAWDSAQQASNVDIFVSSPIARWRVTLEADTNIFDVTDSHYALRNSPFVYYVNDASTAGDVYTTGAGSDTNLGLFAYAPKATLASLLDTLDVEGSDVILIDTGVYNVTNSFGDLSAVDAGSAGLDVIVRGSTNGTTINRVAGPSSLLAVAGDFVRLRDLRFVGGQIAISGGNVDFSAIVVSNGGVTVSGRNNTLTNTQLTGSSLTLAGAVTSLVRDVTVRNGGVTVNGGQAVSLRGLLISGPSSTGVHVTGSAAQVDIRNCTIAARGYQLRVAGSAAVTFENNIAVADGAGQFCLLPEGGILASDYNNLVARNGAWVGARNGFWERLVYWQRESGQDLHSLSHEPLFADEAAGDYHLKSVTGRYSNGVFVADAVHSPSIDAGNPAGSTALETAPNGSRLNQGAFGGQAQASRSRTNAWLLALTMNDGGVIKGAGTIRWNGGNLAATNTVTLQYSADGGATWTNFATGIAATNGAFLWNTTSVTSSLTALWRVVLDSDTNVQDAVDTPFAVRNAPLHFYVNDASLAGDVFTTAPGAAGNSGLVPSAPKASIGGVLDAYDTEGGDTIHVDTGVYASTSDVTVIWSRGGDTNAGPLSIVGSTNAAAGGAVISRGNTNAGNAFDVRASHVTLRGLTVRDAYRGFLLFSNTAVRVERSVAVSNEFGLVITRGNGVTVVNDRLWNNRQGGVLVSLSQTTTVANCTFFGNVPYAFSISGSAGSTLQNNIFGVDSTNAAALAGSIDDIFIDYNVYYFTTNAPAQPIHSTHVSLLPWQLATGHDFRSAVTNPLFANAAAGDFHLRSSAGRYVDNAGFVVDLDPVSSWAIDKANPSTPFAAEPAPAGGRANIGAYGGTEFASKGVTNAVVTARMLNDATVITATNSLWPLIWSVQNVPTGETFRVQYSGDNGLTWTDLQTGLSPYGEVVLWQTTPYYNTYRGRWRVVGAGNTNYVDMNDAPFEIFYGEFAISAQGITSNSLNQIVYRGAWGENYRVQYTTNIASTNAWFTAPNGPGHNQTGAFLSTNGGDFTYQDVGSLTNRFRLYRVLREQY